MIMLTSNNSLSGDSSKSSGSSSLNEIRYNISFNEHLNDEYINFSGKDERYWERRRKNNAAAKRSRERRRQHDMELEQQIQNLKLINSKLQIEITSLHQRINFYDSIRDHFDIAQLTAQNLSDVSTLPSLSDSISPCISKEESFVTSTHNFQLITDKESLNENSDNNSTYFPLDLSCKLPKIKFIPSVINKGQSKMISRNSAQGIQDQKYLDRRRRNNEAVRKCRQNKRAKNMNNIKSIKEDKDQIKIKIESISSELERLKTHIKQSEEMPTAIFTSSNIPPQSLIMEAENPKNISTKARKWKSKLIEANQADKEMS